MRNPIRVTVALDDESYAIFNKLKDSFESQSETIRRALKFYYEFKELERHEKNKIITYVEMLSEGEHVILDIDHWVTFLKFIESHPESEKFWEIHKQIAKAHAEEFEGKDIEFVLKRLEACNFFRLHKKNGNFTLILNNEITKKFIVTFLEEVLNCMGYRFEIKEELMKIVINTDV